MATQWTAGLTDNTGLYAATLNQIGAAWNDYTPVITCQTGAITSYASAGRWGRIQNIAFVQFQTTITNAGTGGGALYISYPIQPKATTGAPGGAIGTFVEWTVVGMVGGVFTFGGLSTFALLKYDWTTPIGTGRTFGGFAVYEVA